MGPLPVAQRLSRAGSQAHKGLKRPIISNSPERPDAALAQLAPAFLALGFCALLLPGSATAVAVAVEALAADVPLVSTDCSFLLQDLIVGPEAGVIVRGRNPKALAQALIGTLEHPAAPGRRPALAAPFEPGACARAYLQWFDSLHG